jgi:hypothetical protein
MTLSSIAVLDSDMPLATVRLHSDALKPDVITEVLEAAPDMSAVKGGKAFRRKDGSFSRAQTGTWFATTAGRVTSYDPEEHLTWVVNLVRSHINILRASVPGIQVEFSLLALGCNFRPDDLPVALLNYAAALGDTEIEVPALGINHVVPKKIKMERHLQPR